MAIIVRCAECGAKLQAKDSSAGRKVRCPKCKGVISVPEQEEEPIDLAKLGVKAETSESRMHPLSESTRRRADEDEEDDSPRRRRPEYDEDDDDDYDDRRRPRRRRTRARQGTGVQLGLGIASLVIGGLGLPIACIPVFGTISLPLSAVGLVLGIIGMVIAFSKGAGHAFPVAGAAVSVVAVSIALIWVIFIANTARNIHDVVQKGMDRVGRQGREAALKQPLDGAPTPVTANLTLVKGTAHLNAQFNLDDPLDRFQARSRCKVYTLTMVAGKRYQIDMMSDFIDSVLRLEDPDGLMLDFDDDSGEELNARINHTCQRDGTYRIVATTFDARIGPFTLHVQER